jgi:dTDP-4-dehydrorhamnose 3,5-epimerase-like enzyme
MYNCESLGIDWMIDEKDIQLSEKDKELQTFMEYSKSRIF